MVEKGVERMRSVWKIVKLHMKYERTKQNEPYQIIN